jgi:geranylgeranyl pyrophosphate synthase
MDSLETIFQDVPLTKLFGRTDEYNVHKVLNDYITNPGKMIRPQLIHLFGKIFNISSKDQILLSRAAEMIHTASLIHDDVVDDADLRRGMPALNRIKNNSLAVLAGDFLLARVIVEMVDAQQFEALRTLSQALEEIVEGEFLQSELKKTGTTTKNQLIEVSKRKTGALLAWSCSAVAQCSKSNNEIIQLAHEFGIYIGIAFQLIDDNLDYSNDSGKDYAKDLKEGLINFTTLNLIRLHPELYYIVYQIRGTEFDHNPWSLDQINSAKEETKKEAHLYLDKSKEILTQIIQLAGHKKKESNEFDELFNFLEELRKRSK